MRLWKYLVEKVLPNVNHLCVCACVPRLPCFGGNRVRMSLLVWSVNVISRVNVPLKTWALHFPVRG